MQVVTTSSGVMKLLDVGKGAKDSGVPKEFVPSPE
jgi:hypothetical protein